MEKIKQKKQHIFWMQRVISLAQYALSEGKIPSASVVVWNNFELGIGINYIKFNCYLNLHSEINAIKQGTFYCSNKFLKNSIMYTTLEPCLVCLSTTILFKIKYIIFGVNCGKTKKTNNSKYFKNKIPIGGHLEKECANLLNNFFILHRHQ